MAALLSKSRALLESELTSDAGAILLSTLISVKHAGVAFVAHRSLQRVCEACLKPNNSENTQKYSISQYPSKWASRIWKEISTFGKVRDSTLRRSTGFALAFLSIMRSEASLDKVQHRLCSNILSQIMRLSLPPQSYLQDYCRSIGLEDFGGSFLFSNDECTFKDRQMEDLVRCNS